MRRVIGTAIVLGFMASVMGVLLQGASASGLSLWGSLKGAVIEGTLEGRFGRVWGLRALDWVLLGVALLVGTFFGAGRAGPPSRPRARPARLQVVGV